MGSGEDVETLEKFDGLELPAAADMHVHLREGDMTDLVVYVSRSHTRVQQLTKI